MASRCTHPACPGGPCPACRCMVTTQAPLPAWRMSGPLWRMTTVTQVGLGSQPWVGWAPCGIARVQGAVGSGVRGAAGGHSRGTGTMHAVRAMCWVMSLDQ